MLAECEPTLAAPVCEKPQTIFTYFAHPRLLIMVFERMLAHAPDVIEGHVLVSGASTLCYPAAGLLSPLLVFFEDVLAEASISLDDLLAVLTLGVGPSGIDSGPLDFWIEEQKQLSIIVQFFVRLTSVHQNSILFIFPK